MRKKRRKYEGFSLVETLFTIVILSIVMLLVSTTLNTVIRTSHTANSKNLARSNINYVMETYDRLLSNARLDDIHMYDSSTFRTFGFTSSHLPVIQTDGLVDLSTKYDPLAELDDGQAGNEVHVKLYGVPTWTCIGYFEDDKGYGYIVKTSTTADLDNDPSTCFDEKAIITLLHSYAIDVEDFSLSYIDIGDEENKMFIINAQFTPLYWPMKDTFDLVTRGVSRQLVVSTRALTRY